MPKGITRAILVQQVLRAIDIGQKLDEERIHSSDASTARSYVSFDSITILSGAEWQIDGNVLLSTLRGVETPRISSAYINEIFGQGMNGIRERAWLRFVSGHLNVETLRLSRTCAMINGKETRINIFEIKVTPSMKNLVYSVYVVFTLDGDYVGKLSKCDCPNGWLFCSHTLATFLLIYLIQTKSDWDMEDVINFMPEPIKSLQNTPIAASYIFSDLEISKPGAKKVQEKEEQITREKERATLMRKILYQILQRDLLAICMVILEKMTLMMRIP